nr:unnamed protein product [Spirometra erinaceieuropaei]
MTPGRLLSHFLLTSAVGHASLCSTVLLEVEADEVMMFFDVVSLFTSIPPALTIDTIDGFLREKYDEIDQQLKRVHIIELLELCLKTFFTFNGQIYEQKKGTPMGSPLSGLIDEAVLQRLERLVFSSYPPKFWDRYVDDTFVIIKRSDVQTFKALLNSIFPDIQFTMKEELNNQLAFLDVQVRKLEDGKIRTTVYRKATNTRRQLCQDPLPTRSNTLQRRKWEEVGD